jgi:hypothetical protein
MGNYHVPFWRAVDRATSSLTLIILAKGIGNTDGQSGINAWGQNNLCLVSESLLDKLAG